MNGSPHAVVTNDDGIESEGLRRLARAAVGAGCDVVIAAPDHEASGSSASITAVRKDGRVLLERRKLADLEDVPGYALPAVPAFIAFTAVRKAFGAQPDLLLSGINFGPNTGRAVLHSGTVGAAMTAAAAGVRAAAFSLDAHPGSQPPQWDTAEAVAAQVIPLLRDLPPGQVLNVNIPNVPPAELRGIRQGPLAEFGAVQINIVEAAQDYLQVTMSAPAGGPAPGSDSALLADGYAAVTVVQPLCEPPASWLPWSSSAGA
ncbi:MAG: 5'/3'-nucleotidase SurE [Streptosporangiaceae bacterium]